MQSHIALSKSVLSILWNIAQEEKCHKALIQNRIPEVITPLCFNSSIQIRWESKSFLAVLYHLTGPWSYPLLKLSVNEIKLLRLCFQNAAVSDDHNVILQLGKSLIRYSASELALGITSLTHHSTNRIIFADPKILSATFNLLLTGSIEEKIISIQLMSKLVDEPETCSIILANHPDILEVLQSLGEDDEAQQSLRQDASMLLRTLLNRISGVIQDSSLELKSFIVASEDPIVQRKEELKRLLFWATREMNRSKVLHNAADNDTTEVVMSMIYLISHLCEMLRFEESRFSIKSALQECSGFLSVLQDYTEKHFLSMFLSLLTILKLLREKTFANLVVGLLWQNLLLVKSLGGVSYTFQ